MTTDSQRDQQRIAQSRRLRSEPWSSSCLSRSEHQRPLLRLQRLGWTDPNLHRVLDEGPSESAYGSLANELLIDLDASRHLKVQGRMHSDFGRLGAGKGAAEGSSPKLPPRRRGVRRARQGSLPPRRPFQKPLGLLVGRFPRGWLYSRSLCRRPGFDGSGGNHTRSQRTPGRRAPGRGPPRRPPLDKIGPSHGRL